MAGEIAGTVQQVTPPAALASELLQVMPDGCIALDADARILSWNPAAERLLGVTADAAIGQAGFALLAPEPDRSELAADFTRLRAGETVPERTLRGESCAGHPHDGHPQDGQARWHTWTMVSRLRNDGSFGGALLLCRDDTARMQREAECRGHEERRRFLEAVLQNMTDVVLAVDTSGRITLVNSAFEHEVGLTAALLEGRDYRDPFFSRRFTWEGEEIPEDGWPISRALRGETTLLDGRLEFGNGREIWLQTRSSPLLDEHEQIVGAVAVFRNVNERRRAEVERETLLADLERERRHLDVILRQMPAMVVVYDADGYIVRANDEYLTVVGVKAEQILGRDYRDLPIEAIDPGRPIPASELPSVRALRGEEVSTELGVVRLGQLRWLHVSAVPIRGDGGTSAAGSIDGAILIMRDITSERGSLAALRASEARNRALLDAIPDSLYRIDRNGIVLERRAPNDGRARMHDVYVGRTLTDLLGEDVGGELTQQVETALRTMTPHTFEYARLWPTGPLYREARIVPIDSGQVLALIRDIGDRKQAEREREQLMTTIENERRRLDAILRQVPNTLVVLDRDGLIVEVNDGLIATIGVPKERMLGRETRSLGLAFRHPDGRLLDYDELPSTHALRGEESAREFRVDAPDGRQFWIRVAAGPIRDERGEVTGAILSSQNVTAEREAMAALRESEARNRALLDAIPDSIYVGDRDGMILDYKPPRDGRPMPNLPMIGRRIGELWPSDRTAMILAACRQVLDSGETTTLEYQVPTPNGLAYREARVVPCGENRILALVRDVDARRRAEEALQQLNQELELRVQARTSELEAANHELEAFSYSVSHDLKAPLRGIDGYSQLLWEDYRDRLDEDGRFLLESVRQGAAQMHQLIDDLLAYSRLERRAIDEAEIELLPIFEGLLAERAEEIRARSMQVRLEIPNVTVRADRDGLAQAVRNLLDNALRFTAAAAEPHIEIGGTLESGRCTVWVRDNGIGFDMAYHEKIFEIFQRLQRVEEYPGTGIGLALVRKAMQRMGGRAWAESTPGDGATFYLEIPR